MLYPLVAPWLRRSVIVMLLVICGSWLSPADAALIKPGASCRTAGKKVVVGGVQLKCQRQRGKLQWVRIPKAPSAVAAVPTSAPSTPEESPSPHPSVISPWSTSFTAEQLVYSTKLEMRAFVSNRQSQAASASAALPRNYYQDEISIADRNAIELITEQVARTFSQDMAEPPISIVALDEAWASSKAESLGRAVPRIAGLPWSYGTFSNGIMFTFPKDSYSPTKRGMVVAEPGMLATPPHEYFHLVQSQLSGNWRLTPAWLNEGTASVIGFYFASLSGAYSYESGRRDMYDNSSKYSGEKATIPLSQYLMYSGESDMWPYGIGQIASEYLIASVGFQRVLDIFRFSGQLGRFDQGFQKATGMSIEDFYALFERVKPMMHL